jgi:AcrR family transcriptional regulator
MKPVALATPSAQRDEKLIQRALTAAIACIEQYGVQKLSMDHIAAESGISRATLYRRFGSRDGILTALIHHQAEPYTQSTLQRAASAKSFAERIKIGTIYAVQELPEYPILKHVFSAGATGANLNLLKPTYEHLVFTTLKPSLKVAKEMGELRSEIDIDEVSDWLMREFLLLVSNGPWEETSLLNHIEKFILPVLIPDKHINRTTTAGINNDTDRLHLLEEKVDKIYALLSK